MSKDGISEDLTSIHQICNLPDKDFRQKMLKIFKEIKNIMEQTTNKTEELWEQNDLTSNRNERTETMVGEMKNSLDSLTSIKWNQWTWQWGVKIPDTIAEDGKKHENKKKKSWQENLGNAFKRYSIRIMTVPWAWVTINSFKEQSENIAKKYAQLEETCTHILEAQRVLA